MKINEKILSIPPYISTTWSHISALRMKGNLLSITMTDGESINVSGLSPDEIHLVFSFHAAYLEKEVMPSTQTNPLLPNRESVKEGMTLFDQPTTTFSFAIGSLDEFTNMLQHNPDQADAPDLPPEVLNKISQITKAIMPEEGMQLPEAEPHCNCFNCQIARVVSSQVESTKKNELGQVEEEVLEHELHFEEWAITQTGDNLYNVINRFDEHEKYSVYLGEPMGCTCGKEKCEHILAVLKS